MAPLLFGRLRGLNISCASPASTAICSTRNLQKARKNPADKNHTHLISPAASSRYLLNDHAPFFDDVPDPDPLPAALIHIDPLRFHSAGASESRLFNPSCSGKQHEARLKSVISHPNSADVSPPPSSAKWQEDTVASRASSSSSPCSSAPSTSSAVSRTVKRDHHGPAALDSSSSIAGSQEQVVVLRVSLHCKGCAAKVRKHLSRMEGVKSFNVDFATKKVTVIGDVTPLGVLSSISKVKNAQFWPPMPPSSSRQKP